VKIKSFVKKRLFMTKPRFMENLIARRIPVVIRLLWPKAM
jgi:hypothetical protein